MKPTELHIIVYAGLLLGGLLTCVVVMVVVAYRKKQLEHVREHEKLHEQFKAARLQSQIEITEQALQSIAQELHDNVGQRLTIVGMHLNSFIEKGVIEGSSMVAALDQAQQDLRSLSRSLAGNYILENGLELAVEREALRIGQSGSVSCTFESEGERHTLSQQQEVIMFRCFQEAVNNALKHSGASQIVIKMNQGMEAVHLEIRDNGTGLKTEQTRGQGLNNMRQRMALLNGSAVFGPGPGGGTRVVLLARPEAHRATPS